MNSLFSFKYLIILLIGGLLSVLSCLYFSDGTPTILSMLFSVVFVLLSVNMSLENQMYMIAIGIPNTKALGFGGISASIVICFVAVLIHFIKDKKKPSIPLLAILLLLYSMQYLFRNDDYRMGAVMPIKTVANILFFVFLSSNVKIASDSFNIALKATIALLVGIVSAMSASIFGMNDAQRVSVVGNDPNMLSIEIAFVLSVLSVTYYSRKQFSQFFYLVAVFILGVLTMMCGSRMGIVLYALVLFGSVFLNAKEISKTMLLVTLLGIGITIFLLSPFGQSLIEAITLRIEVLERSDNVSNGRFEIWQQYFNVLNSNDLYWLFGLGSFSDYGIENMAHNFLLEDVAAYGIIGVILLYFTYFGIYKRQYKLVKRIKRFKFSYFFAIPFFVPLIGSLTLHGLGSIMITTMLYLGILCMTGSTTQIKNTII